MSQDISSSQKKVNFNIHPLISTKDFLALMKRDPFSIVYDFDVRYATETLRVMCSSEINEGAERAKALLRKAGLSAFIPPDVKKRRTKHEALFEFQSEPLYFGNLVRDIQEKLKQSLNKTYKKRGRQEGIIGLTIAMVNTSKYKKDLKRSFESILKKKLTELDLETLIEGDGGKDFPSLALSLLSYSRKIPFPDLKGFYYSEKMAPFR